MSGAALELIDLSKEYRSLKRAPIIINDAVAGYSTAEAVKILNDLTRVHYNGDALDITPTCGCGELSGKFNEGQMCRNPKCSSPEVKRVIGQDFDSHVWFKNPVGRFINPIFWVRFNSNFSNAKDFDIMRYLTDSRYRPLLSESSKFHALMRYIDGIVPERSLSYITQDLKTFKRVFRQLLTPEFIKILYTNKKARVRPTKKMEELLELIDIEGEAVYCKYMPYPSKWSMVTEQSGGNTFADPTMLHAIDAAKTIAGLENSLRPLSPARLNSKLVDVQCKMSTFYVDFIKETTSGKYGLFRRQLGATRTPWSGRVVIIPHIGPHEYDEVTVPWSWIIVMLRNHIEGVLMKPPYNYTPKEMSKYIDTCICNYDDQMYEILKYFINNSVIGHGIPMAMLRNPTLEFLSNQFLRITDVFKDPYIYAMRISNLIIKNPNADFDGDMTQCKLLMDQYDVDTYRALEPSNGMMSLTRPYQVSSSIVVHPETISLINNYRAHCLSKAKNKRR